MKIFAIFMFLIASSCCAAVQGAADGDDNGTRPDDHKRRCLSTITKAASSEAPTAPVVNCLETSSQEVIRCVSVSLLYRLPPGFFNIFAAFLGEVPTLKFLKTGFKKQGTTYEQYQHFKKELLKNARIFSRLIVDFEKPRRKLEDITDYGHLTLINWTLPRLASLLPSHSKTLKSLRLDRVHKIIDEGVSKQHQNPFAILTTMARLEALTLDALTGKIQEGFFAVVPDLSKLRRLKFLGGDYRTSQLITCLANPALRKVIFRDATLCHDEAEARKSLDMLPPHLSLESLKIDGDRAMGYVSLKPDRKSAPGTAGSFLSGLFTRLPKLHTLDLRDLAMPGVEFLAMLPGLSSMHMLRHLHLCLNKAGDKALNALADGLPRWLEELEELGLFNYRGNTQQISDLTLRHLTTSLPRSLMTLQVYGLSDDNGQRFLTSLAQAANLPPLRTLLGITVEDGFNEGGVPNFSGSETILTLVPRLPDLQQLELLGNLHKERLSDILSALIRIQNFRELDIDALRLIHAGERGEEEYSPEEDDAEIVTLLQNMERQFSQAGMWLQTAHPIPDVDEVQE